MIFISNDFENFFKTLNDKDKDLLAEVIRKIESKESLGQEYKIINLQGDLKDFFVCYVKPDLLLIYKEFENKLILVNAGNEKDLFK
ncbi:type II toxin-antitoxin system mRNA interferase toxin, RelE/StbE family [Helicobacter saguini]|uniref:Type II toxin-antitoxin system mRNA interferase toxin, RelE/StbE family n=1 Tax=Helicobacter saguini TaxID=1548018 RepID=A0A099B6T1_9HELI|nr:type II toxin-antitoxin system mRNA interferase toxin, RelE/StbE family [Helicobacter saguini]MWV61005.1 type II toxin-antitoxin system mRNA interferase toxin, RelE/StbE family [Helicobacter saguini]MWV68326.1 type II toxin-antitoxin system mRNA interferase toxin, RelE/StbE family [Helicobacter saguini]MWV70209.1 type II toxin-antitoxin system mRNA interferase toxin, RelE/StbE family [Helicobacter saguini]MWV72112.1 type II toxin-antitoxin system mRNA interferase toxin, RelE/StbE family [Hel